MRPRARATEAGPGAGRGPLLGIDPGSRFCGYGVVGADGAYVTSGRFVLEGSDPLHKRLKELHEGVLELIDEFSPTVVVVEKVFYANSVRSALVLGQVRGIVILAAAERDLEIDEYSALQVKKAVTGYGRADKEQMQATVRQILGIRGALSSDGADALALTLCHLQYQRFNRSVMAARG